MNIGVLTGGGDAPGLNAAIRAVTKKAIKDGHRVFGISRGWLGAMEGDVEEISLEDVSGILPKGGTILKTSRKNPLKDANGVEMIKRTMERFKIDALIAMGGDDTLGVALELYRRGVNVIGVPKTIDNDLSVTDFTIGFDTALNTVMESIDKLHSTAESHDRVIIVEVMGRNAGWIALFGGLAGGADYIAIPEREATIEDMVDVIKKRKRRGRNFSIIVIAEGAMKDFVERLKKEREKDEFGHARLGGVAYMVAEELKKRVDAEVRVTVLGHVQRGGAPSAFDRIIGTMLGIKAVELAEKRKFGKVPVMRGSRVEVVDLEEVVGRMKKVPEEYYRIAETFFG